MSQNGPFPQIGGVSGQSPTLIPQFSINAAAGPSSVQTLAKLSPAAYLAKFPRVNSTITATIGGTATSTTTVHLTVTGTLIPGGSETVTYTVGVSDTLDSIAAGLAGLINADAVLNPYLSASADLAVVTVSWPGPVGNFAVLTGGASADETVVIPNSGKFSGGTGSVYVWENFNWSTNGVLINFMAGNFYEPAGLAAIVAAGMPVQ